MTRGSFTGLRTRIGLSVEQLASEFEVEVGLVHRWSDGAVKPPVGVMRALELIADFSPRSSVGPAAAAAFSFIDLFAGIGGLRRGFEAAGGRCVFTCEWNEYSRKTYRANFPDDDHEIAGDIRDVAAVEIPEHDLLLASFPCQPFSIAGVSKKNALGRSHGFHCEAQGTLFFDIARIIEHHRPRAFVLENVKNLLSHDKGQTFRVIRDALKNELGYEVHTRVINSRPFVPQHRERIFIVGFRDPSDFDFNDLTLPPIEDGPRQQRARQSRSLPRLSMLANRLGRRGRPYNRSGRVIGPSLPDGQAHSAPAMDRGR